MLRTQLTQHASILRVWKDLPSLLTRIDSFHLVCTLHPHVLFVFWALVAGVQWRHVDYRTVENHLEYDAERV